MAGLGETTLTSRNGFLTTEAKADRSALYLAAKGTLPLSERFSLIGKVGISRNFSELTI